MVKEELIQRSPMRVLEKSMNGGLKAGEIGVISSKKGIGKTAVLVQIALDKLMQGEKVIHVSFSQHADYIITWYEDIFLEISKKKNLEDADAVKSDAVRHRVIMNFNQDSLSADQILKSLRAMIVDGSFSAKTLIIDGYDFSKTDNATLETFKNFAKELELTVWFSCNIDEDLSQTDKKNLPSVLQNLHDALDFIVVLDPKGDFINLNVAKDHGTVHPENITELKLDARSLLVALK